MEEWKGGGNVGRGERKDRERRENSLETSLSHCLFWVKGLQCQTREREKEEKERREKGDKEEGERREKGDKARGGRKGRERRQKGERKKKERRERGERKERESNSPDRTHQWHVWCQSQGSLPNH